MKHFSFRGYAFPKLKLQGLSNDDLTDFVNIIMKTREHLYNNLDDYFFYSCIDTPSVHFNDKIKGDESVDRFVELLEPALEDSLIIREIDADLNDAYLKRCGVNYLVAVQMGFRPTSTNEKVERSYDSSMKAIFDKLGLGAYNDNTPLADVKRVHNTISC